MKKATVSRLWLILAFTAIYFVWGTTYLANLFALKALTPFIISTLRYLMAGLLLAGLAYLKKQMIPVAAVRRNLSISGILMLVGGSGLVVAAEQYISSGSAAVIVATEPLWFVLLDYRRWKLYFSNKMIVTGLLIGFVGIALFAQFPVPTLDSVKNASDQLLGIVIVLVSCMLWVIGTLFASRRIKPDGHNLWYTAIQLIAAGIFSAIIALINGEGENFRPLLVPKQSWLALSFLIVFGSLIAYLAFAWLVTVRPPAIVSTHTYVNPVIAVFIGWLMADEKVADMQILALAVALVGVVLTQIAKTGAKGAPRGDEVINIQLANKNEPQAG